MGFVNQLAENTLTGAAAQTSGGIVGTIFGKANDRRQLRQQQKLNDMQMQGNMQMMKFGKDLDYEMWKKTGFTGQMEQIKEAGLSPGLIYGMGGASGTTTGGNAPGVSGGNAPSGGGENVAMAGQMQQLALLDAQRRNLDANTNLTNKTADNKGIEGENIEASTMSILQGVKNQKAQETKTKIESDILTIEKRIKGETADDAIQLASWTEQQAGNEVEKLYRENIISKATMAQAVDQIKANLAATILHNEMTKAQTENIKQQTQVGIAQVKEIIQKMVISMREDGRNVYGQNLDATQKSHDQWVNDIQKTTGLGYDVVEKVLQAIVLKNIIKGPEQTPIKGFHNR